MPSLFSVTIRRINIDDGCTVFIDSCDSKARLYSSSNTKLAATLKRTRNHTCPPVTQGRCLEGVNQRRALYLAVVDTDRQEVLLPPSLFNNSSHSFVSGDLFATDSVEASRLLYTHTP